LNASDVSNEFAGVGAGFAPEPAGGLLLPASGEPEPMRLSKGSEENEH
jgi:hypothetical protein